MIVVERVRHHHGKHWKRKSYRAVVVYYIDGRYYDRINQRRHSRVREVVVYERNGRYYRLDDRNDDRWDD